jgi:hypothetical protein
MRRSSALAGRVSLTSATASCFFLHVLDLFGCLPEEEVRTDGGAEDTDDDGGGVGIWCETGPNRAQRHLTPRDVDCEQDRSISEQGEGQPLKEEDVTVIGDENL